MWACVLHIFKLVFPPIYIQHSQCPCRCLLERRALLLLWSQPTRYHRDTRYTWQIQQGDKAMQGQPQWTRGQKKKKKGKPAHQTVCIKKDKKETKKTIRRKDEKTKGEQSWNKTMRQDGTRRSDHHTLRFWSLVHKNTKKMHINCCCSQMRVCRVPVCYLRQLSNYIAVN